jgi:hypothetical protein
MLPVNVPFSAEIIPDQEKPLHCVEARGDHLGLTESNSFGRERFATVARRYAVKERVAGESSGQRAHSVDMDRGRCPIIQTTQKRRLVEYRMRDIVNKSEIDMDQLHAQVSGRKNLERTF